ncbi:hypothetical protein NSA47_10930 [Irregularibacter muris]|uniref:Uncharacterized protein n=1 Tax=Irregularibacter muris TaxID=1796619 RepID=A0AAE3HHG7_9FIRM|nr:hypothetical protein [Irregularibacter muris]MCR1899499.1 hypothetical protein [Irregularibacter muris]
MASSYERKFIFLTSEDKNYAMTPSQPLKGHIEIERRQQQVNFKVFVDNVKPMEYEIQLLTIQGIPASLGYLRVEDTGKAQGQYKAAAPNIMGTGLSLQDFGVILVKDAESTQRATVPLVGWLQKEKFEFKKFINSKKQERQIVESIKAEEKEVREVKEEIEDIRIPEKEKIPEEEQSDWIKAELNEGLKAEWDLTEEIKNKEIGEPKQEENIEPEQDIEQVKEDHEEILEEAKEVEDKKEKPQETIEWEEKKEEEKDTSIKEEPVKGEEKASSQAKLEDEYWVDFEQNSPQSTLYHDDDKKINIASPYHFTNENLDKLDKIIKPFQPFEPELEDHRWWRVIGHERELEVYYLFYNGSFVPLMYPYMQYRNVGEKYIKEPNPWIFGVTYADYRGEKKLQYYVYGILGRFYIQEQPFQGSTGFLYWHPLKGNKREQGALGYWLLYIDARTGAVTVPHRPTMPPVGRF